MLTECPWEVEHNGHHAWFQRALLIGDFAPGLVPVPWFVVYADGRAASPLDPPKCATCAAVPATNELIVIEIATGDSHFLAPTRSGLKKWPKPTDPKTCWWCNSPRVGAASSPAICEGCAAHLATGA